MKLRFAAVCFSALVFLTSWTASAQDPADALATVTIDEARSGCQIQALELAPPTTGSPSQVTVRIDLAGEPSSLGARLDPPDVVVLDLAGCDASTAPPEQRFESGLVSYLNLSQPSESLSRIAVTSRRPFEYSVSSGPGYVHLQLMARDAQPTAPPANAPPLQPRVRVMEPLPLPKPAAPLAAPGANVTDLEDRVESWRQAWAAQDVDAYLDAYATDFRPTGDIDRRSWEVQRRQRLSAPRFIEVAIEELDIVEIASNRAEVGFWQTYTSDSFADRVYKKMILSREQGAWKILEEVTAEPPAPEPPIIEPPTAEPEAPAVTSAPAASADALLAGARLSIARAPRYDPAYRVLSYPGGDPGLDRGTSMDLIVRAYRQIGADLQELMHADILAASNAYGVDVPNTHIDHRRIRNFETFLQRQGQRLSIQANADWQAGDIVFWSRSGRKPDHVGLVSDTLGEAGLPRVIHHLEGATPSESDDLFSWEVRGHYRWLP